jgi:hypothetical protein
MSASTSEGKRGRTSNYTSFEKNLLVELTKENPVVLSKQRDSSSNYQKEKAWSIISEKFNSTENVSKRDIDGLKVCLSNIQAKAKKEDVAHKVSLRKTGGGPSSPLPMSATSTAIIEMMPQVFKPFAVMDCDKPTGKMHYFCL